MGSDIKDPIADLFNFPHPKHNRSIVSPKVVFVFLRKDRPNKMVENDDDDEK